MTDEKLREAAEKEAIKRLGPNLKRGEANAILRLTKSIWFSAGALYGSKVERERARVLLKALEKISVCRGHNIPAALAKEAL